MKFVFVILAIAMMVQVSLAKREVDAATERQKFLELTNEVITAFEHSTKETLNAMPHTEEYSKYRTLLEEMKNDFEEYHTKTGNCFIKTKAIVNKYKGLPLQFIKFGFSPKYKEVKDLLEQYRGDLDDTTFMLRYGLAQSDSERVQQLGNLEC